MRWYKRIWVHVFSSIGKAGEEILGEVTFVFLQPLSLTENLIPLAHSLAPCTQRRIPYPSQQWSPILFFAPWEAAEG